MDKLRQLSQDKATLGELGDYLTKTLHEKLIAKALKREDVSGFAEANEIIKTALHEIDDMFKPERKIDNKNQAE